MHNEFKGHTRFHGFDQTSQEIPNLQNNIKSKPQLDKYTLYCLFTKNNTRFTLCSHWEDCRNPILTSSDSTYDCSCGYYTEIF